MASRRTQYWLDGYNVIKRLGLGADLSLEEQRASLARLVARIGGSFWIVFDSKETVGRSRVYRPIRRVTLEYTRDGMSADDRLVHRAATTNDLNHVIVVSDDREVVRRCRFYGAKSLGVHEFMKRLETRESPTPAKPADRLSEAALG